MSQLPCWDLPRSRCPCIDPRSVLSCSLACPADSQKQIACTPCPAGKHCPGLGNKAPVDCPAGSELPQLGKTACSTCPQGTFAASKGTAQCSLCDVGRASSLRNVTSW
jgi:hypothetical protein